VRQPGSIDKIEGPDCDQPVTEIPPVLVYDRMVIPLVLGPVNPQLREYHRLNCFTDIPSEEDAAIGEHFVLAKAGNVKAFDGKVVDQDTVQMLQIAEDPPKLVERPPFMTRPAVPLPFHLPEEQDWLLFKRVVTENTNKRRIQSARKERGNSVKEYSAYPYQVEDIKSKRSVKSGRTPVKIYNLGEHKQMYRNLASIFSRVRRK
jgi:hypothetical protein